MVEHRKKVERRPASVAQLIDDAVRLVDLTMGTLGDDARVVGSRRWMRGVITQGSTNEIESSASVSLSQLPTVQP